MKRSEHFNVVAVKCLNVYSLSVNGRKYAISGVSPDNNLVLHCLDADEPVPFLANWKIGTYGFAKDKFPFIVPFHKFNPDNIGESLQHNVVKQQ